MRRGLPLSLHLHVPSKAEEIRWQLVMALFAEQISCGVLSAANPDGTQAGTVLSMVHRAEGRRKALLFADRLRQVWLRADAQNGQSPLEMGKLGKLPNSLSLNILAFGRGVLVVDKPAGLTTEDALEHVGTHLDLRVSSTSRLDKPTSGILPVCLGHATSPATSWLRAQWAARLVSKSYVCLCAGQAMEVGFTGEVATPLRPVPGHPRQQEVSTMGRPARSPFSSF